APQQLRTRGLMDTPICRGDYLRDENWLGSYYELSLDLGPCGDDELASIALQALWQSPRLAGPWEGREGFGGPASKMAFGGPGTNTTFHGALTMPDGSELGCRAYLIRVADESDWLNLSIPTSMLELRYPVTYPLDSTTNPWLRTADSCFVELATSIYRRAPFRLGLLGEECGGFRTAAELSIRDCEVGGLLVPLRLWNRLSPSRTAELLPEGLAHVPFLGPHITYGQ
ncbi:MAG TPA: hypothetical protein VMT18_16285, partial [Planctomycetota bacterium]|nr:hypothetical protein [Planctomycetota bacterium]